MQLASYFQLYLNSGTLVGGLDGGVGVPNSVFNKKCHAYS